MSLRVNYIFDFDGTIADSLEALIAVYNKNIRDNKNPLTPEEIQALRGMSSRRALRHVGVRWWQLPKLLLHGMPDFRALIPRLRTFPGLPETLRALTERGDKLYIVTSNTRASVDEFLKLHSLDTYFTEIIAGAGVFNKAKYICNLIKEHGLKRRETVYIGDETRDIQAARLAALKVVSVTWGFNTEKILKKRRPNYLIDKPEELLKVLR